MPKSRKRKTSRGGRSSRTTYSSKKQSQQTTKRIAVFAIIALVAAGLLFAGLFVILRGSTPAAGSQVTTASGLKYIDEVIGTGESPRTGRNVTVHYTGTLENGTKFESSVDRSEPYTFRIGTRAVIDGWDEGIMTMKVGGKRRLIIPPDLAYGAAGRPPTIPPNATLIFEIELLGVN